MITSIHSHGLVAKEGLLLIYGRSWGDVPAGTGFVPAMVITRQIKKWLPA